MTPPLKPCPFCGGKAEIKVVPGGWGYRPDKVAVGCPECKIEFSKWAEDYLKCGDQSELERPTAKVVEKWNTRKGADE